MIKYIGWIVLNIQLSIGFYVSFNFINRALIKENFSVYIILVFICSNLLFLMMHKLKYFSIRAFFSIIVSSFIIAVILIKFNNPTVNLKPVEYALILGYLLVIFKIYITTPIAIAIEFFLKWKKKKTLT